MSIRITPTFSDQSPKQPKLTPIFSSLNLDTPNYNTAPTPEPYSRSPVQLRLALALCRLNHKRAGHRPTHGGRVVAVVHQALGNVLSLDACRLLQGPHVKDELVCAGSSRPCREHTAGAANYAYRGFPPPQGAFVTAERGEKLHVAQSPSSEEFDPHGKKKYKNETIPTGYVYHT